MLPKISNLKCYVLPGHIRDCQPKFISLYNQAYEFWRHFMGQEMRTENLTDIENKLSSDGFMLFEDIYVLCDERDEPENPGAELVVVGLFCFDTKDITSRAILDQSYFKSYPNNILEKYILPLDKIMTIGHLLVHPDWRRSQIGIGLSDILVWFMHQRFLESGSDLMIYFTRNNRGTNQLGTKFGGEIILQDYQYGGLAADVIATKPSNVVMDCGNQEVNQLSMSLWQNREFCAQHSVHMSRLRI